MIGLDALDALTILDMSALAIVVVTVFETLSDHKVAKID